MRAREAETACTRAAHVLRGVLHAPRAPRLQLEVGELDRGALRLVVGDRELPRQRVVRAQAEGCLLLVGLGLVLGFGLGLGLGLELASSWYG